MSPSTCLTFDFDAMCAWITSGKSDNPSQISRGEFAIVGLTRVLALLARHEVRATFFVPGHTVLAYPSLIEQIAAGGHELGHHGWAHENPAEFDADGERRHLELGLAAYDRVLGQRPVGYRSPAWDLSHSSVELLLEAGFTYESSCMGSDFHPYYLRSGDRWSTTEPYVFGRTTELIEVLVSWALDDFPHFELVPGFSTQQAAPEKAFGIWRAEFDYLAAHEPGGSFVLTMHPEVIGRAHRVAELDRFVGELAARGASFESLGDVAARFAAENPLDDWIAANPLRTGAGAIQSFDLGATAAG